MSARVIRPPDPPDLAVTTRAAASRALRAWRASPSARSTRWARASSSRARPRPPRPRSGSARARVTISSRSSPPSGSSRNSSDRLIRGALTVKNGFSVVAPTRTTVRSSTPGSRASCWLLLKRWISSMNRMLRRPRAPRRSRAAASTARTSLTPALVADSSSKCDRVAWAMMWASEVFPVPAGPHRITDRSSSASISARRALPGPSTCPCPTNSSRVRGRIRAASGASWSASRSARSENRSMSRSS